MASSILNDIKKMLGLESDYKPYDTDITILINGCMMTLQQYGVGPKQGFILTDASQTWDDFFAESGGKMLEAVKTYIYLKVKMVFDPPGTTFVMDAFKETCQEIEWRLKEQMESYPGDIPRVEADPSDSSGSDGENTDDPEDPSATDGTDEPTTIGGSLEEDGENGIIGQSPLNNTGGGS